MVFLAKIDPNFFGRRDHRFLLFKLQVIRNKDGSTPTTNFLAQLAKENKHQERKRKLDMNQSITTRNLVSKKSLVMNSPKVTDYTLQLGGRLLLHNSQIQ